MNLSVILIREYRGNTIMVTGGTKATRTALQRFTG